MNKKKYNLKLKFMTKLIETTIIYSPVTKKYYSSEKEYIKDIRKLKLMKIDKSGKNNN
jgi:hypothetical protein